MILERDVESYLHTKVTKLGGLCHKLSSQHEEGWPDRLVLLPEGKAFFVELKTIGGRLSPMQKHVHKKLRKRGHKVYVPFTKQDVDMLIEEELCGSG